MKKILKFVNIPILMIGILISIVVTYFSYSNQKETAQYNAMMIAGTAMNSFHFNMEAYLELSDALAMVIEETDGEIRNTEDLVEKIYNEIDGISYVEIYQVDDETVTIYPIDAEPVYEVDMEAVEEAQTATFSDPFTLSNGELGIALVTPLYLDEDYNADSFYGAGVFLLSVSDVAEISNLSVLDNLNYNYCLLAGDIEEEPSVLLESGEVDEEYISLSVTVGDEIYSVLLSAKGPWVNWSNVAVVFLLLLSVSLLFAISMGFVTSYRKMNKQLQQTNDKLTVAATRDPLTGLYNRRGGEQKIEEFLANDAVKEAYLLEVDLDKFKSINDIYGHEIGDRALKQVTYDMKSAFGLDQVYIRNGGDEFIIFIAYPTDTLELQIKEFAEGVHSFTHDDVEISFSVSCGYASYPNQATKIRDLIKCADEALYEVKHGGRHGYAKYSGEPQV